MRDTVSRCRFSARITREGTIIVPGDVMDRFRTGQTIMVSVAAAQSSPGDSGVGIDEDEVGEIAALQAEPMEVVRSCLRAQGALAAGGRIARETVRHRKVKH